MKKLGFGMMRLPMPDPKNQSVVDREQVCAMVDAFLDRGFTYFDTAYMYHDGESEGIAREALVRRHPRDSFTLADKMPLARLKDGTARDQDRIFHEQLEKCGVDYFDYYLLHNLNAASNVTVRRLDTFQYLLGQKEAGRIRRLGFSFHDKAEVLDQLLTEYPQAEFVQLQLNYLDWDDESVQSRKCYEVAVKHGKPVVVMEPVKGGKLAAVPDEVGHQFAAAHPGWSPASWAIRFAASQEYVMMVLSGMSSMEQLLENTGYMDAFQPLSQEDQALLERAAAAISAVPAIPCTGCRYCVEGCPQAIPIPEYFALYNQELMDLRRGASTQRPRYQHLAQGAGKASDCLACRRCEDVCPQHLPITDWLRRTAQTFED